MGKHTNFKAQVHVYGIFLHYMRVYCKPTIICDDYILRFTWNDLFCGNKFSWLSLIHTRFFITLHLNGKYWSVARNNRDNQAFVNNSLFTVYLKLRIFLNVEGRSDWLAVDHPALLNSYMDILNLEYCIQGNIRPGFIFAPFTLAASGRI